MMPRRTDCGYYGAPDFCESDGLELQEDGWDLLEGRVGIQGSDCT
jgi:hypothetical protein